MRAIIFAAGSDGEIHPHLGIGRELMARGHEVVFITTFDYVDAARACGFEVLSFLERDEKQNFVRSVEHLGAIQKIKRYCRFLTDKVYQCCELARSRIDEDTILVSPPFFYVVAKLLHAKFGTPYLSTVLVPAHLYSLKSPPSFKSMRWCTGLHYSVRKPLFRGAERLIIDPFFRMLLKESARQLDVPLPSRVISRWWYSPQKVIGLFYDWFCPAPDDWPDQVTLTGFPMFSPNTGEPKLSAELDAFLGAGPPPVVFNPGTESQNPREFFEAALNVTQAMGVRAIFLTRLTEHLPTELPDTVRHETYLPLGLVLPRAAALVHHGGIGTIALALQAGVPQLVMPGWTDQLDNGERVVRLGCGLIQQDPLDSEALTQKLQHLLTSPQVHEACLTAQALMQSGASARSRAVDAIEQTFRSAIRVRAVPVPA